MTSDEPALGQASIPVWLGEDTKISMDVWNVYTESEKRTNNHVEGWNSKFMKVVGKHHPNIFQFVDALKREQAATELKVAQHDAAILPPQKKRKHIVTDQRLAVLKQSSAKLSACSWTFAKTRVTLTLVAHPRKYTFNWYH